MRKVSVVRLSAALALVGALGCGGGDEGGTPATNAEGTADTEMLQHNPDSVTGSPAGGGAAPGTQAPAPTPP